MSQPPSASSDRDSALHRILAEYWDAIESGQTPDQAQWLIRHPKFQAELSEFFADWNQLHSLAAATRQDDAAFSPAPPFRPPDDVAETRISCPATVVSGQSALVPGTFGSYDLLAELGQGGMGVVYQARQHQPERLVALKMLRPGHQASAVDLRRFKEEAEAVARLDHLHIVPVYEVGEHERVRFYTMKLLTGGSLAACLPRFVEDPQAAARILVPVARAVQHAHGRGVLHRDLKPSNILLDDSQRPYVADLA